jgi:hypothetical protein
MREADVSGSTPTPWRESPEVQKALEELHRASVECYGVKAFDLDKRLERVVKATDALCDAVAASPSRPAPSASPLNTTHTGESK